MALCSSRNLLHSLRSRIMTSSCQVTSSNYTVRPTFAREKRTLSSTHTEEEEETPLCRATAAHHQTVSAVSREIATSRTDKFAVVHVKGNQFKVSINDVIQVDNLDLDPGTVITLDKVLLVGSLNYTLVGRPLLPASSVTVTALVIERGRGPYLKIYNSGKHAQRQFFWGKTWHHVSYHESLTTMLRITNIQVSNADLQET